MGKTATNVDPTENKTMTREVPLKIILLGVMNGVQSFCSLARTGDLLVVPQTLVGPCAQNRDTRMEFLVKWLKKNIHVGVESFGSALTKLKGELAQEVRSFVTHLIDLMFIHRNVVIKIWKGK